MTIEVRNTPFEYSSMLYARLLRLDRRVQDMRRVGKLSPEALRRIRQFFKIKGIYHSNAIEGNSLTIGETKLVIQEGITLTGKTLKDQAEASNLSHALDFMESLAVSSGKPIVQSDLRQIHALILQNIESEFAGRYRNTEVKISGSDYEPTPVHLIPQQMDELVAYIAHVTSPDSSGHDLPLICATAAHAWLAQIHPFVDGNGRTCRILMNLILMRRGYPICIITRDDRQRYYQALEDSQASDLTELLELVLESTEESLEEWEKAADEQVKGQEWLHSITSRFEEPELNTVRNEYQVWLQAMDLFKSYFKQLVDDWNDRLTMGTVRLNFRDFGSLSFEKYLSLREGVSAKRTWDFGIEFIRGDRRARYLFYCGYSDYKLRKRAPVALILAKNTDDGYVRLSEITQSNIPDVFQVGFDISSQAFVALTISGIREMKVEEFAKMFFNQVVQRDFGN